MNCLTKLFQQKRRRIGYILAFSGPMISKRDSSDYAGYDQLEDTEEYLFRKLSSYQHENEIRFYFLEDNIVNLLKENVESEKLPPKYFNVSPEDMILHLYFSPFIRGDSAKYQEDLLVKHFSFLQDRIETFKFKNR